MKAEIETGVGFLCRLLGAAGCDVQEIKLFNQALSIALVCVVGHGDSSLRGN
jgi:hypothetical protein